MDGGESSLGAAVAELEQEGYEGQFAGRPGGKVLCFSCGLLQPAVPGVVEGLLRVEGASNPGSMAAVVAMRCPACGVKGTLVLPYGAGMDAAEGEVLRALVGQQGEGYHRTEQDAASRRSTGSGRYS